MQERMAAVGRDGRAGEIDGRSWGRRSGREREKICSGNRRTMVNAVLAEGWRWTALVRESGVDIEILGIGHTAVTQPERLEQGPWKRRCLSFWRGKWW